ncbi:hypothetical protein LCGC14_1162160 [marine sediment metagenome]|uniref:Uncharacterized protein n=1 Tax=marine sediment metagenome TaxID=412755 RepID=A0A0F9LXB7_9ZZZZ
MEVLLKRAERPFKEKIGEEKTREVFDKIIEALNLMPNQFSGTLASEIPRFILSYSQNLDDLSTEKIEGILLHVLILTRSLSSLSDMNSSQVNQKLINRSKSEMRNVLDLLKKFVEKAKVGELINKEAGTVDDILDYILGEEKERLKFTDVGGFLKRAEKKYTMYLRGNKGQKLINDILSSLAGIPEVHRGYLASDISRFLAKYSETLSEKKESEIERTLTKTLNYSKGITKLKDLNKEEMNQFIINRSKHKVRNLFELYKVFLEREEVFILKEEKPSFDEILDYTLGRSSGPKALKSNDENNSAE